MCVRSSVERAVLPSGHFAHFCGDHGAGWQAHRPTGRHEIVNGTMRRRPAFSHSWISVGRYCVPVKTVASQDSPVHLTAFVDTLPKPEQPTKYLLHLKESPHPVLRHPTPKHHAKPSTRKAMQSNASINQSMNLTSQASTPPTPSKPPTPHSAPHPANSLSLCLSPYPYPPQKQR